VSETLALFAPPDSVAACETLAALAHGLRHLGNVAAGKGRSPGGAFLLAAVGILAGQLDLLTRREAGLLLPDAAAVAAVRRRILAAVAAVRRRPTIPATFGNLLINAAAALARIVYGVGQSLAA